MSQLGGARIVGMHGSSTVRSDEAASSLKKEAAVAEAEAAFSNVWIRHVTRRSYVARNMKNVLSYKMLILYSKQV